MAGPIDVKPGRIAKRAALAAACAALASALPVAAQNAGRTVPAAQQRNAPAAATSDTVARLRTVDGSVLVSQPTGLGAGQEGRRLVQGARVITSAKASVIIEYDDGCEVRLKANQRFVIDTGVPCGERVLLAQGIGPAPSPVTPPSLPPSPPLNPTLGNLALSGTLGSSAELLAAGAMIGTSVYRWRQEDPGTRGPAQGPGGAPEGPDGAPISPN